MGNNQGKTLKIGSYHLNFVKQIAEGGFSYVFLVKDSNTSKLYALKRILIREDDELKEVKHEISIMKKLTKNKNIVKYFDYHKSSDKNQTEVFILMEYCSGGHLVELMQKKLNSSSGKFTDQEILKIFQDVCEGVAYMHSQSPPIIHRDLKVENVLLDEESGIYKLCDFGSATQEIIHIKNKSDMQRAEDDIQRHTTLQYRAPEIVDFYRSNVINEKIDIWALGCLLYKLLFYTTPFEDTGSLGILNANYTIPTQFNYSQDLISLIKLMLNPDPKNRPNIFEITNQVCQLRNQPPIFNNYKSNILSGLNNGNGVVNKAPKPLPKVHSIPPSIPPSQPSAHPHQQPPPLPPSSQQQQHNPSPLPSSSVINNTDTFENNNINNLTNNMGSMSIQQQQPSTNKRRGTPSSTPSLQPIQFVPGHSHSNSNPNMSLEDSYKESPRTTVNPFDQPPPLPTQPLQQQQQQQQQYQPILQNHEEILNLVNQLTNSDFTQPYDTSLLLKLKLLKPGKGIMHMIVKRPLKEPLVCLKSLLLVHALLSEGNNIPFKNDVHDSKDLFNNLYLGWLKQKDKYLYLGELLAQYSYLLYKFVCFHHKNYMIDGGFAFEEMKWGLPESLDSSTHPISCNVIKYLFEIMDHIFLVQNSLSEYCSNLICNNTNSPNIGVSPTSPSIVATTATNNTNNDIIIIPNSILQNIVNILNNSSYSIFCFISGSIESLTKIFSDNQERKLFNSVNQFQNMYQRLRDQYNRLNQLPCFSDVFFPTLPNIVPTFNIIRSNSSNRLSNSLSDISNNSGNNNNNNSSNNQSSLSSSFDNTPSLGGNPFSNEPTFNPFSTGNTNDFGFGEPSPRYQQTPSTGLTSPNQSNTPNQMSPVIGAKKPPLPPSIMQNSKFPHSSSLEDARLYTFILTPSPSPPLSPSFGRLSHSNSNVVNNHNQSHNQQHQQQLQQPQSHHPTPFDNFNINGNQQTTTTTTTTTTTNNNNINTQTVLQSGQSIQHSVSFQSGIPISAPNSLNSSSSSIQQHSQQQSFYSGGGNQQHPQHQTKNSLMPPIRGTRGHRRSQSNTTDELRRRNLLQQQLDQNRDFLNHQRLVNKNSRLNNNGLFDDEESPFDDDQEDSGLLQ